jgi:hypothetical protein
MLKNSKIHRFVVTVRFVFIVIVFQSCHRSQTNHLPNHGYPYPISYMDKDSNDFFFPLRSKLSKRDSLSYSYQYWLYHAFQEPNLSLRYIGTPTYRISYYEAFGRKSIISLSGKTLTVKDVVSGSPYPDFDTTKLTGIEKQHYQLLLRRYPLDDTSHNSKRFRHYLDSIVTVYPELVNPAYYKKLIEKIIVKDSVPFVYSMTSVLLTDSQLKQFLDLLDKSGYWNLPYDIHCDDPPTDGEGFILEANTEHYYNAVGASSCSDSNSSTKLKTACQQLIDYSGFGKQNPDRNKQIIVID